MPKLIPKSSPCTTEHQVHAFEHVHLIFESTTCIRGNAISLVGCVDSFCITAVRTTRKALGAIPNTGFCALPSFFKARRSL
jgi:hypothetical protein